MEYFKDFNKVLVDATTSIGKSLAGWIDGIEIFAGQTIISVTYD